MSRRVAKQQAASLDQRATHVPPQSHEYTAVSSQLDNYHLAQIKLNLADQKILKHSRQMAASPVVIPKRTKTNLDLLMQLKPGH